MGNGLTTEEEKTIAAVFAQLPAIERAVLFGSRAMGLARSNSDVDIALYGEKLGLPDILYTASLLEDTPLPYQFDLISYASITSPDLLEHIRQYGKEMYRKENDPQKKCSSERCITPDGRILRNLPKTGGQSVLKLNEADIQIIDGDRGKNYPNEFSENGYCLFLSAKNVTSMGFSFNSNQFISKESDELLRKGKLQRNDVVLTTRGTVGNVALYDASVPYDNIRINSGMVILRCNHEKVNPTFLYYTMKSKNVQDQIVQMRTGSAQPQFPISHMVNLEINLPDLATQCLIAAILSSLDDKIENNKRINQHLEQMAQAIFTNFLSQGNGTFKALRDVAQINTNTYSKKDNWEFVNYLDTGNITDGKISIVQHISLLSEKLPSRAKRKIFANDIVYSTVRPNQRHFGIITYPLEQMLVSTGFVVIRSKNQAVCNELIYLHLTSVPVIEKLQRIAEQSTSTYPSIKPSDIGDIQILVPSTSEFDNIKALLKPIFQVIGAKYAENIRLATIRDTLLPKLLSGEIRIPEAERMMEEMQ